MLAKQEALKTAPGGLYGSNEYIKLQSVSFWFAEQQHIMAFNAILTWIKVFKFLEYNPNMSILTTTLLKAGGPIVSFMWTFIIVLVGSGQGFYLAFGLDLYEYRGIIPAWLSLLRATDSVLVRTPSFYYDRAHGHGQRYDFKPWWWGEGSSPRGSI